MTLKINPADGTIKTEGGGGITLTPSASSEVTIDEGILLPDGTKSAPAVRFTDDLNTGIYSPTNDIVAVTGHGEDVARFNGVVSSVNYLDFSSSATGTDLKISASGTDTDVGINLVSKGTGTVKVNGTEVSILGHVHVEADISNLGTTIVLDSDIGSSVQAYNADTRTLKDNLAAAVDPTANEDSGDGYAVGSQWINTTLDTTFVLVDATVGAAVWNQVDAAGGGGGGEDYFAENYDGAFPTATGTDSLAIGEAATAAGNSSVMVGSGALGGKAEGTYATVVGYSYGVRDAATSYGTAIGFASGCNGTTTTQKGPVAIGHNAGTYGDGGVAVGSGTKARGERSVAVGSDAGSNTDTFDDLLSVGSNAKAGAVAGSVAIGADSIANGSGAGAATALGFEAEAVGYATVAIGKTADCEKDYSVCIGGDSRQWGTVGGTVIGFSAKSGALYGVVIGNGATANNSGADYAIAIGYQADCAKSTAKYCIALGRNATAKEDHAISIGHDAGSIVGLATTDSIQIGTSALASSGGLQIRVNAATSASTLDMSSAGVVSNTGSAAQFVMPSYTVATLPTGTTGGMIFVSDETGGAVPAFYDGTNWRRTTDRAIVA